MSKPILGDVVRGLVRTERECAVLRERTKAEQVIAEGCLADARARLESAQKAHNDAINQHLAARKELDDYLVDDAEEYVALPPIPAVKVFK